MDRRIDARLVRRFLPLLLVVAATAGCEVDPTGRYLVMIGALFLLGAVGEVIFAKTQIPDVVWLVLAGVVLRVTGLIDPVVLDPVLPLFSTLTLIVVLFDGGRQIVIEDLVKEAPRATALAVVSFLGAMFAVAVVVQLGALTGLLPDSWTFLHSLMVGAILGGSSSLVIMPSMAVAKVKAKISNLVGLESALTDALCVVVAVVLMNLIQSGDASGTGAALELGENFGLALLIGLIAGWAWMPVLRGLSGSQYSYPITLAALLFLTVTVDTVGGNAAMAVLTFSVVVGNAESLMKMVGFSLGEQPLQLDPSVVTVHTQVAFIIKSCFFTYIGLMLAPPWSLLLLGVLVGFTLFGSRIPATMLVVREPTYDKHERKLVAVALPRGMAAGVLATMPATMGVEGTKQLPSMVFAAVVTSIAIFAVGFRKVRTEAAVASAATATATQVPTDVATQAMPDGLLPLGIEVPQLPAAPEEPAAEIPSLVVGDMMLDGQPSPPPRTSTAYGIAPIPIEPAKPPSDSERPTSPGIPLTTLHGLPAVQGGPPPPDARPVMGGAFAPKRPSNSPPESSE